MERGRESEDKKKVLVSFRTIAHFFDPDDPAPESDRELSDRAEDMIGRLVLDTPDPLHAARRDRLEVSIPGSELTTGRESDLPAAIRSHFLRRAEDVRREMRLTQRIGLREIQLTVGVCVPCLIGIAFLAPHSHEPLAAIAVNVLTIFSWVVIWQPFQSLVFDRWTKSKQAKVFQEIAGMEIAVVPG
ncbi:MAG: hypothetical protein LUQ25_01480 [Methanoregulaceae archaeon]|nr:hypothetical protein [Methanoregulaceae archaeon]